MPLTAGLAAGLTAALLALGACTTNLTVTTPAQDGPAPDGPASSTSTTLEPSQSAGLNMSDMMFVQMMIPHHQQAIEMSRLAYDAGASPEVLDLAKRIEAAQGPEIDQMAAMLERWDVGMMMDHSGHMMAGMVDDATMNELKTAKGADFDRLYLESMIAHHQGAIDMTEDPLANGSDPQLHELLLAIVEAQTAEIAEMEALLES